MVCFIVHKTTSELEHAILTTLYLAGTKNTNKLIISCLFRLIRYCIYINLVKVLV
jgi:hypothetical protein